ncbi:hypothetical protein Bequi_00865 [Brachybacterium sp. JHP9]|uniref:Uncharacterized protein n=1 Tax=Brachybacterium equifaecis TaxID=2910770 RepID=A0ABT0QWA4_9MICO|nr:hypothetical protein [Brachybacterium equifaecis]MCL6421948.1 hypothetical protein [Brachybacterium equifaecis]
MTPSTPAPATSHPAPESGAPQQPASEPQGCGSSCTDAHDHTGHDHGPTGADIVRSFGSGLAIVTMVIPALAVVMLLSALVLAPATPLPLLLGIGLGGAHLLVLVLTSLYVSRTERRLAVSPGLLAVRSTVEELLRLAAVLVGALLWPFEHPGALGVWVGAGAALVWMALATAQTVSARRRMASPSNWSKNAVATFLAEKVSVRRSLVLRVLDVIGSAAFQIGATVLIFLNPLMTVGTIVLSIATGLSTLVLHRRSSAERARTPWAYAPFAVGALTLALAILGISTL